MLDATPLGPSSAAGWEERQAGAGSPPSPAVLLAPDAANDTLVASGARPILYYMPARPLLARDAAGNPVFSLTLVLSRTPGPETESVAPLIAQGVLTCALTLALPNDALQSLTADVTGDLRPLFARDAAFEIALRPGAQAVHASGQNARASLTSTLDRAAALAVLAALDGTTPATEARCTCRVTYRAAPSARTVRLSGTWAAIYDYLAGWTDAGGELSLAALLSHFSAMVRAGIIAATAAPLPGSQPPAGDVYPAAFFDDFMRACSIILERVTPELAPADPRNCFTLGQRPGEAFVFEIAGATMTPTLASRVLDSPIAAVFGGALAGLDRDRFISLVALASEAGPARLVSVPVKVRDAPRTVRWRRDVGGRPVMQLAAADGVFRSLAATLRPSVIASRPAEALVASDGVTGGAADPAGARHWAVDDVILVRPEVDPVRPLPIVDDSSAPVWRDRLNAGHLWYAPAFEVVQPAPNADPATSPFHFSFVQQGLTANAKPGLNGTLHFTLRQKMSDATAAALRAKGGAAADPVPLINVAVSLEVPFRDQTGATKSQAFPGEVRQAGDSFSVTVELLDDWVRLAYGALGQPGLQAQPAALNVTYSYEAYVPLDDGDFQVVFGGKVAVTPIVYSAHPSPVLANRAYVDASGVAYHLPLGTMAFAREAPADPGASRAALAGRAPPPAAAAEARASAAIMMAVAVPVADTAIAAERAVVAAPAVIARPPLESSAVLAGILHRVSYGIQTLVHQESPPASFPCATLGAFYRQIIADGIDQAVGCQDALTLGQTAYRQYAEMPELQRPQYRVYRSLQQPGLFLVVPTTYRITRYAASDPAKAYRPAILVYSVLDAQSPANSKSLFAATLQPDIPPFARRALLAELAAWAQTPRIIYPTEVESVVAYTWGLVDLLQGHPAVVKLEDSFQVTLATNLTDAMLLLKMLQTGGVYGTAVFTLPDGSSVQSGLALELTNITGPWDTGPISVALQGASASLTNQIKACLAVHDLVIYSGPGAGQPVAVEATLPAGASLEVALTSAAAEAYAVYIEQASVAETPGEVRVFAEDIQANVVFLDLVNYVNHGLQRLDIQARLKDVEGTFHVAVSQDQPVGSVDFILPLTSYLASQIVQFQVTKTMTDGTSAATAWLEWDLAAQGNIVSVTWEYIQ